jgi:nucleoside-diphosphate kinase
VQAREQSSMANSEVLAFVAEWYDPQPQITRSFLVKVFTETSAIEVPGKIASASRAYSFSRDPFPRGLQIVDLKTRKCFLKNSPIPPPTKLSDFVVGGKVVLYSRLMSLVDYGDAYTRHKLAARTHADGTAKCRSTPSRTHLEQIALD